MDQILLPQSTYTYTTFLNSESGINLGNANGIGSFSFIIADTLAEETSSLIAMSQISEILSDEASISNKNLQSRGLEGNYRLGNNLYISRNGSLNSSYFDNITNSTHFYGRWSDLKLKDNSIGLNVFAPIKQFELLNDYRLKSKPAGEILAERGEDTLLLRSRDVCQTPDGEELAFREEYPLTIHSLLSNEGSADETEVIGRDDNDSIRFIDSAKNNINLDQFKTLDSREGEILQRDSSEGICYDYEDKPVFFEFDCSGTILGLSNRDKILPKQNIFKVQTFDLKNFAISQTIQILASSTLVKIYDTGDEDSSSATQLHTLSIGDLASLRNNSFFAFKNESFKYLNLNLGNNVELWGITDFFRIAPGEFFKLLYSRSENKFHVVKKVSYLNITSSSGLFFKPGELEELGGGGGGDLSEEKNPKLRFKPSKAKFLMWGDDFGIAQDDFYETWANEPIIVENFEEGVLVNDAGAAGNLQIRVGEFTQPENGTLVFDDLNLGTFTYTPNLDFVGSDKFSYYTIDSNGFYSTIALVEIEVTSYEDHLKSLFGIGDGNFGGGGGGGGRNGGGGLRVGGGDFEGYLLPIGLDGDYGLAGKKIYKKNLLTNAVSLFSDKNFDRDSVTLVSDNVRLNGKDVNLFANDQFNKNVWYLAYITVNGNTRILPGTKKFIENFGNISVTADGLLTLENDLSNLDKSNLQAPSLITYTISNGYLFPSQEIKIDNRNAGGGLGEETVPDDEEASILRINISGKPGDQYIFDIYEELILIDTELTSLGFGLSFNELFLSQVTGNEITIYSSGIVEGTIGAESDFFYVFTNNPEQIMAIEINISVPTNEDNIIRNVLDDRITKISKVNGRSYKIAGNELSRVALPLNFREQDGNGTISATKDFLTVNPNRKIGPTDDSFPDRLYNEFIYNDRSSTTNTSGLYIIWSTRVRTYVDFRAARPRIRGALPQWSIFILPLGFPGPAPYTQDLYVERVKINNIWYDFSGSAAENFLSVPLLDTSTDEILGHLDFYRSGRLEYAGIKNGNAPKLFVARLAIKELDTIIFKDYTINLTLARVEDRPNTRLETDESAADDLTSKVSDEETEEASVVKPPSYEYTIKLEEMVVENYCEIGLESLYKIDFEPTQSYSATPTSCKINELYLRPIDYTPLNYEQNTLNYCDSFTEELYNFLEIDYALVETQIENYCGQATDSLNSIAYSLTLIENNSLNFCEIEPDFYAINYDYIGNEQIIENYCDMAEPITNKLLENSDLQQIIIVT